MIVADDWSSPHASILGDPVIQTPNFDRIAQEGALFPNAFASAPSCTPSRFAIAAGQYHWRLEDGKNLGGSLPKETPVYADLLNAAGYRIGHVLKGAAPSAHKFRESDPFGPRYRSVKEFLDKVPERKPFCLWFGSSAPHRPYTWRSGAKDGIDIKKIPVPPFLPDNNTVRTDLGDYYKKVQDFDDEAGKILTLLEIYGALDNTIVVMTSDNGMPFPRAKATLYDAGTHVPLAIRWPGHIKPNRVVKDFVSLIDLAPTFLQAGGVEIPDVMTGRSLFPQLEANRSGQIDPARVYVLTGMERHVYPYPARAIRTRGFLYIRNFNPARWPTGEIEGPLPHVDFVANPWPTDPGSFSFNCDPSPTKQWMLEHNGSSAHAHYFDLAFGPRRDDELYDLKSDPHQLIDVARREQRITRRQQYSQLLTEALVASGDPRPSPADPPTYHRQNLKGWTIHINESLRNEDPEIVDRALDILGTQLGRVAKVVPPETLAVLRTVPLWLNPPPLNQRPSAEYHPEKNWLIRHHRNPDMAKAIEFTNASILPFENQRMPFLVLHELAHAYHDQVLGFNQPDIVRAFNQAKLEGNYDKVQRRTGQEETIEKAYAISNHKEYFAEASEAYFGENDFFPFNREELKQHDRTIHDLLETLWTPPSPSKVPSRPTTP
ncbi:MAG: sulfatase-like hydrolase/transferase [Verrucomicrobiota bacterium]